MVDHIKQQLTEKGIKLPPVASSPPGKGKTPATPPAPRSAAVVAREQQARADVVQPGRLAWVNTVFGVPAHYRKFRLLDPAHADALDALFHRLTGTTPDA